LGAVILAGGKASRLHDKCFRLLGGKPLVLHVFERISRVTRKIVVVAKTAEQMEKLNQVLPDGRIILDQLHAQTPLVGFLTGLRALRTKYVFAASCDAPFIEPLLVRTLFEFAVGNDCAVPASKGKINPLVAVYNRATALRASTTSIECGKMSMKDMIALLKKPVYVPAASLRGTDPDLMSFQNVNTPFKLSRARWTARRQGL
jgi:molybdopterin-guanine dinucleotide biosynthesis protein A